MAHNKFLFQIFCRHFDNEISEIEKLGIDVRNNLKISFNCHIIDEKHIEEEFKKGKFLFIEWHDN